MCFSFSIYTRDATLRSNQAIEGYHKSKNRHSRRAANIVDGKSLCKSGESWLRMTRITEKLAFTRRAEIDANIQMVKNKQYKETNKAINLCIAKHKNGSLDNDEYYRRMMKLINA